jgi:hypothetical protein
VTSVSSPHWNEHRRLRTDLGAASTKAAVSGPPRKSMRLNENPAMTRGRSELPLRGVHGDYCRPDGGKSGNASPLTRMANVTSRESPIRSGSITHYPAARTRQRVRVIGQLVLRGSEGVGAPEQGIAIMLAHLIGDGTYRFGTQSD